RSRKSTNADRTGAQARVEIEVTHPFHPWRGRRFVLATRKQNWGEDRVMFYDAHGRLRSLLASWTNVDEQTCSPRSLAASLSCAPMTSRILWS
ncbi:DUF5372 family protein, partial [Paraburkholderia kirstenboschensis]|uniref:DUF5372 family protein n=1 Tax=Paraburkholderia kirstenboschensis TaxID=1245436 RepID=UPI001FB4CC9B